MSGLVDQIARAGERITAGEPGVLVTVESAAGSTPREAGTVMLVFFGDTVGTIGGGALEHRAERRARSALRGVGDLPESETIPLGPAIGQCCGGSVMLRFRALAAGDLLPLARWRQELLDLATPLWLFGAGHVGEAVADAVAPLPFTLTWIDSRPAMFSRELPSAVTAVPARAPHLQVDRAPPGSLLLIMTHSHAQDFDIVDAALKRSDLDFVGLIGSATKRSRFIARLRARGHGEPAIQRLVCPIGVTGIAGKQPEIIAASVAVQLLRIRETMRAEASAPISLVG